jgi:uncharacterized membrane protein
MTQPNTDSNTTPAPVGDGQNVITVSFADDRNAYNALTSLEELDTQRRIGVREAVVVARREDGQVVPKDSAGSSDVPATAAGGLTGLLIGIIGGPLGMLLGGTYGLFAGSLFDLYDMTEADSSLAEISTSVAVGRTALLAVVDEANPEVVDAAMSALGGNVVRRPVAEVQAEIAAAEKAERQAKLEARKELVRGRKERDSAAVQAKLAEVKAKLRRTPTPSASAS